MMYFAQNEHIMHHDVSLKHVYNPETVYILNYHEFTHTKHFKMLASSNVAVVKKL